MNPLAVCAVVRRPWMAALGCLVVLPAGAWAAPKVADTLAYEPIQAGVEYDRPEPGEVEACTVKAEKVGDSTAWVVRSGAGVVLRQFADTNNDKVVDRWSYYSNGVEVYRDIDSDFDNKADQSRWFHQGGTRWGIDRNQDGKIDQWKRISAEEAAEEAVHALAEGDSRRFASLLLTAGELKTLGLEAGQSKRVSERIAAASKDFAANAKQAGLSKQTEFSDFGGLRPGLIPAEGKAGKDLLVYENAWAMVQDGEDHNQLNLGTMVRVGDAWKLIDAPAASSEGTATAGLFYSPTGSVVPLPTAMASAGDDNKMQELLTSLDAIDQKMIQGKAAELPKLNRQRAELLGRLAAAATSAEEQRLWLKQIADTVGSATQMGQFDGGVKYLASWEKKLAERAGTKDLVPYFQFQRMLAEYMAALGKPGVDHAKTNDAWLESLEAFVKKYPKSEQAAEAYYQLALGSEISDPKAAAKWYQRIVTQAPQNVHAPRARGALTRLAGVGKPVRISGAVLGGGKLGLNNYRGKVVVVQYWATSPDVSKTDHAIMKELYTKYRKQGLEILGVNLDYDRSAAQAYLKKHRLPWKQLHEEGGFESRLATEMGVPSMPMLLLIDQQGRLVDNDLQATELEEAVQKLLTSRQANQSRRNKR